MLQSFAIEAVVEIAAEHDPAAIGAAITIELCGSLDHTPPCPLAAHHTRILEAGDRVRLRVLFVTRSDQEAQARARIYEALTRGTVSTVHGDARWRLLTAESSPVLPEESEHAQRLVRSC